MCCSYGVAFHPWHHYLKDDVSKQVRASYYTTCWAILDMPLLPFLSKTATLSVKEKKTYRYQPGLIDFRSLILLSHCHRLLRQE